MKKIILFLSILSILPISGCGDNKIYTLYTNDNTVTKGYLTVRFEGPGQTFETGNAVSMYCTSSYGGDPITITIEECVVYASVGSTNTWQANVVGNKEKTLTLYYQQEQHFNIRFAVGAEKYNRYYLYIATNLIKIRYYFYEKS